jgi:hypothetical protein
MIVGSGWLKDPDKDPGGSKTYGNSEFGSGLGSGSATLGAILVYAGINKL